MKSEDKYVLAMIAMIAIIIIAIGLFGWGVYQAVLEVIGLIT